MKRKFSLLIVFTLVMSSLFILTGCGKEKENKKEEAKEKSLTTVSVDFTYDLGRQKKSGTFKVPEGYRLVKSGDEDEYKLEKGKYAIVGNKDFTLEITQNTYVYNSNVKYKEVYGDKEKSFAGYKEYMSSDLRSEAEGKSVKEFKVGNKDALAYIYNKNIIIDVDFDEYNNNASIRIYVIPTKEFDSTNEAKEFLENKDLNEILSTFELK